MTRDPPVSTQGAPARFAVADIGGTNARFARVSRDADGRIDLAEPLVLATADFAGLTEAWRAFLDRQPGFEPDGAAFALAGPVGGDRFSLTNANWSFDVGTLPDELGVSRTILLNDFEAIAHAIAGDLRADHLEHIAGSEGHLPGDARISVIGPGTGLGVAHFRCDGGHSLIQPTEGAHIDFPPVCELDDRVLALLREVHGRVSVERVVSGDGIRWIHAAMTGRDVQPDELPIWKAGLDGSDEIAARAVRHFVKTLGRVAGDYALAQGSGGVVLAGGLGLRLRSLLSDPVFRSGFTAKGRYRAMLQAMPVKLITHPQPGLLGAVRAYLAQIDAR